MVYFAQDTPGVQLKSSIIPPSSWRRGRVRCQSAHNRPRGAHRSRVIMALINDCQLQRLLPDISPLLLKAMEQRRTPKSNYKVNYCGTKQASGQAVKMLLLQRVAFGATERGQWFDFTFWHRPKRMTVKESLTLCRLL